MAQTVIGMFESSSKAEEAVQELVEAGITRDRIDVSPNNNSLLPARTSDTDDTSDEHESGISKFFKSLFGNDDDSDKYTRVASQAQSIVTVHTQSQDEAERVADILDDHGAVDVNEQAAKMDSTGTYASSTSVASNLETTGGTNSGTNTSNLPSDTGVVGVADLGRGYTDTYSGDAGSSGDNYADGGRTGLGNMANTDDTEANKTRFKARDTDYTDINRREFGNTGNTDYTDRTGNAESTMGYTDSSFTNETREDGTSNLPIIEEHLEVGKREVRTGGARLRSRIIDRPVEESVRLREERVNIERHRVDRPASEADLGNFQERDIEMVEHAEVPVIIKEARVIEEVSITKEVEERTETIKDTVRKTEVDVENLEKDNLTGDRKYDSNDL